MDIQKYLDLFEWLPRGNANRHEGLWCFKLEVITSENKDYDRLSDIIQDSELDRESAYAFTVEALQAMKDIIDNQEEKVYNAYNVLSEYENIGQYSEPPVYNSELLDWVAKANNYISVDNAGIEYGWNGGIIETIQRAYATEWEQHYFKVLEAIKD